MEFAVLQFDIVNRTNKPSRLRVFKAALYLTEYIKTLAQDYEFLRIVKFQIGSRIDKVLTQYLNCSEPDLKCVTYMTLIAVQSKLLPAKRCLDTHLATSPSVENVPTIFYRIAGELVALDNKLQKAKGAGLTVKRAREADNYKRLKVE
ncbi:hypothetical protein CPB97_000993 [Podila verticillata]|nr:hypothetical protein CPB97_000993 [Podila verticillata]